VDVWDEVFVLVDVKVPVGLGLGVIETEGVGEEVGVLVRVVVEVAVALKVAVLVGELEGEKVGVGGTGVRVAVLDGEGVKVFVDPTSWAVNWNPPTAQDPVPLNWANRSWTPVVFLKAAGRANAMVCGPATVTLVAAARVPVRLSSVKVSGPVQLPEK